MSALLQTPGTLPPDEPKKRLKPFEAVLLTLATAEVGPDQVVADRLGGQLQVLPESLLQRTYLLVRRLGVESAPPLSSPDLNRLRRWIASGRLEKLFEAMAARPACQGTLRVMIDSTIVRAHQHSTGALKKN